jgi:hypothetical protein
VNEGQYLVGETQEPLAGRGEADRTGLADEEIAVQPGLEFFQLVGQGGLGEKDPFRGFHETARVAQGDQGAKVSQLDV